jgi:hypothetical protein
MELMFNIFQFRNINWLATPQRNKFGLKKVWRDCIKLGYKDHVLHFVARVLDLDHL